MKRHAFVFIFIVICSACIFSQDNTYEARISQMENSLSKNDTEIQNINNAISKMEQEYNSEHIDRIFNRWIGIQQILIGILGALSLLLPFITYFFGYKPAKDAENRLNTLEKDFNDIVKNRLENYLIEYEKEKMHNAINNLLSDDSEAIQMAVNYINLNQHYNIDDNERRIVYNALINGSIQEQKKYPLRLLLSNKKSIWADLYFDELVKKEEAFLTGLFFVAKYLAFNGFNQKKEAILGLIKNIKENRLGIVMNLIAQTAYLAGNVTIDIANCKELIDMISEEQRSVLANSAVQIARTYRINLEDTELFKYYKQI